MEIIWRFCKKDSAISCGWPIPEQGWISRRSPHHIGGTAVGGGMVCGGAPTCDESFAFRGSNDGI